MIGLASLQVRVFWLDMCPISMKHVKRESAHPNGISYADGFIYLGGEFLCWMLH